MSELPIRWSDPIKSYAMEYVREHAKDDVPVIAVATYALARFQDDYGAPLPERLIHYAMSGVKAMCRALLKKDVIVAGLTVPGRILIGKRYRPIGRCTASMLRENNAHKRVGVARDMSVIEAQDKLANLLEASGRQTVGEAFAEAS